MEDNYILKHIDHTLLSPTASWEQICELCNEAVRFNTATVCVPPFYVKRIRENYPDIKICTVAGFPLGYDKTAIKVAATIAALDDGADEIDMVINLATVKNKNFVFVKDEIIALKLVTGTKILKVIIETCYLTEEEKITMCKIITEAGAEYIKTSTGLGTAGATLADIELFKAHIGPNVKMKAAGGIKTREDMVAFLEAGCTRIGSSSAIKVLSGGIANSY